MSSLPEAPYDAELADKVLILGLDDWVMAADVVSVLVGAGIPIHDARSSHYALNVIEYLLSGGLMTAGDVTAEGFVPWEMDPSTAIALIKERWEELGGPPDLGDVCWLNNTDEGDARAESAVKK